MPSLTDSVDVRLARLESLVVDLLDKVDDLVSAFGSFVDDHAFTPSDRDAIDHAEWLDSVSGSFLGHDS
jgi:hypothetical protein